ncbi:MAG: DMT family transporter [Anaerolineae bacterium]
MSGEAAAIGCAFCWALSTAMVRNVAVDMPSMLLNGLRSLVGTATYVLIVLLTGRLALYAQLEPRQLLFIGVNLGVSIVLGDTAYYASMGRIGFSRALTLSSIYPLITALLAGPLLGESFTWHTWVGYVFCFAGIILVARSAVKPGDPAPTRAMQRGIAFGLLAAVAWAIGTIALRTGSTGLDPFVVNSIRLGGVAVLAGSWARARGEFRNLRRFSRRHWIPLFASGLIGSVAGATLYLVAVQNAGASKAAVLASLAPLFSVPMALIAGESVNAKLLLGIAVTVVGVALVV